MSDREPKRATTQVRIAGPGGLGHAIAAADAFSEAGRLSAGDAARLAVIVEELVANLFDHGGLATAGVATLSLDRAGDIIELALSDPCPPFDPRTAERSAAHDARGGGAGIDLVRAWAEFLDYRSDDDGNRLVLRIKLRA